MSADKALLPSGWRLEKISGVSQANPRKAAINIEPNSNVHFVPMASVVEDFGGIDVSKLRPLGEVAKGYTQFLEGDVLFAKITPCMENGKLAVVPALEHTVGYGSTEFHVLRPSASVSAKWLANYISQRTFRRVAVRNMAGSAGQLRVPAGWLADQVIPVPPIDDQQEIVAKIEELFSDLDAGIASLERARAKLKRYRASVLKSAVEGRLTQDWRAKNTPKESGAALLKRILKSRREKWEAAQLKKFADADKAPPKGWKDKYPDPVGLEVDGLPSLPHGWIWATLDQLASLVRNGLPQKPSTNPPGFQILRISAVRPMQVNLAKDRYLDIQRGAAEDYFIKTGDLLFTRYNGSLDFLGVAGLVRGSGEDILHPDKLIRVQLVEAAPMPEYVEIAANCGESRKHIAGKARTTAGQTGVSGTDIKATPIPLPSLDEQQEIIALADAMLTSIGRAESDIEAQLARGALLKQAILKRAFEGRLV